MHTKIFNTYFKRWVQFRVGGIPHQPISRFRYFMAQNLLKSYGYPNFKQ